MISLNDIYDTKKEIYSKDNLDGLIYNLQDQDPNLEIVNNHDRTILINCTIDRIEQLMDIAIQKWMDGQPLTCPASYTYSILPLTKQANIIRI